MRENRKTQFTALLLVLFGAAALAPRADAATYLTAFGRRPRAPRGIIPNRWRDVTRVLEEADRLAAVVRSPRR